MVGRPRTPLAKAEATGRIVHDPQRYRDRKEPANRPLGERSETLKLVGECKAWDLFRREVPWLTEADRTVVEMASMLRGKLITGSRDEKVIGRLLPLLTQLGATPAARTKIQTPDDQDEDPAGEFLN